MMGKPKIRFKGYNEDWEQRKLNEVAEFNPKSDLPESFEYVDLESVVGTEMVSHRTESKETAPSRAQRLAQTGDVFFQTVRPYQRNNYLFTKPDNNYVFSTGYAHMRPKIDAEFLMCFLQTDSFVKVVLDNCTGTSYPAINSNDLSNLEIDLPTSEDEQRRIGCFITNLDHLITLHQHKCDETKKLKKCMLQKMFPKNGKKVPEIRFDGFANDWEQRKLGDIIEVCSGRDYKHLEDGNIPVYGTGGYMLSVSEALSNDDDAIGIGRKGTIDKPYILKAPFWTVDTLFYCIPKDNYDLYFVFDIFQNINWKAMDESTGVPSLSKTVINKVETLVPNFSEQQKIGNYFRNLDHLITLHQRKIYIFIKKMPIDWEQRKLGELAEIVGGGTPSTSVDSYWDGDIDWYAPAEIGEQIYLESSQRKITEEGLTKSSAKILPIGTVLFTSRAGIGKTAILLKEGCTNQGFQSIVPNKEKLDSYFIFTRSEELKRYGETVGAGSTFVEVSGKQMANMELMMPKTMPEQQQIGEYFANLDHLITLHQHKCDELQNLKKYMLQNMFV